MSNYWLFVGILLWTSCTLKKEEKAIPEFEAVDISQIPRDTIYSDEPSLILTNGIYYLDSVPYSGLITERFENESMKSSGSFYQGMQHGITRTFYTNGNERDIRSYKENVGYGRHFGYWENGKMKFDFMYYFDKREGMQKQWYESGAPYAFLNFKDDKEYGMQQAWRENGKAYINYEVRDGFRYGLQKSSLCYTLKDEAVKLTVLQKNK